MSIRPRSLAVPCDRLRRSKKAFPGEAVVCLSDGGIVNEWMQTELRAPQVAGREGPPAMAVGPAYNAPRGFNACDESQRPAAPNRCRRNSYPCRGHGVDLYRGFYSFSAAGCRQSLSLRVSHRQPLLRHPAKERQNAIGFRSAPASDLRERPVSARGMVALLVFEAASGAADGHLTMQWSHPRIDIGPRQQAIWHPL
jgi:hypothetical protein